MLQEIKRKREEKLLEKIKAQKYFAKLKLKGEIMTKENSNILEKKIVSSKVFGKVWENNDLVKPKTE
jgi:hypothetical protein